MGDNKKDIGKKREISTRLLPKNYRQIGEPGSKKIYIEDYVFTYLTRLAQPGNLFARGAVLFGRTYRTAAGMSLFISGAAACQNIEFDLEETVFSEDVWNEIYNVRDTWFPNLEICGWFLSRMGFSVELNDKIIRMHMDNFGEENKVLYMMDMLEDEDAFYQLENYSLKKQKGYYIYYETNHEMADFMLAEGDHGNEKETVMDSGEIRRDSAVVRNYKNTLQKKKTGQPKKKEGRSPIMAAGAAIMVLALAYGVWSIMEFRKDEKMRAVFEQSEPVWESTLADEEGIDYKAVNDSKNGSKESEEGSLEESEKAKTASASGEKKEEGESSGSGEDEAAKTASASGENKEEEGSSGSGEDGEAETASASGENKEEGESSGSGEDQTARNAADSGEGEEGESDSVSEEDEKKKTASASADEDDDEEVFTQEDPDDVESWAYIGGEYTVKRGDTLAQISKDIYDSYDYVQIIADENGIENVDQIFPGQVLRIPRIDD